MKTYLLLLLLGCSPLYCMDQSQNNEKKVIGTQVNYQLLAIIQGSDDARTKLTKVKALIGKCENWDINFRFPEHANQTLLIKAIQHDLPDVVSFLLGQPNLDVTIEDRDHWPALHHAVRHPITLKTLLENKDKVNPKPDLNKICQSRTALICAVENRSLQAVELLCLQDEVDVRTANFAGTALHQAITGISAEGLQIIRLLADNGALMEALHNNKSPLFLCLERLNNGHIIAHNRFIALLALGAKKTSDYDGHTLASMDQYSLLPCIQLLNVTKPSGKRELTDIETTNDVLLNRSFWIAVQGDTIEEKHTTFCELLAQVINPNAMDAVFGMTALHWAAARGHLKLVKLLLTHPRIDVTARDNFGWTALHYAALNGHLLVVELLLTYPEALGELRSERGMRPIDLAKARNHKDVGRLLVKDQRKQAKIMQYFMQKPKAEPTLPQWRFLPVEAVLKILLFRAEPIGADRNGIRKIIELTSLN